MSYPFHEEKDVVVQADANRLFALLDDHRTLSAHMQKPSLMLAGSSMKIQMDDTHGRALGSLIQMRGKFLGISLQIDEVVIEHAPPYRKTWQTVTEPKLLVIGGYMMGFILKPVDKTVHLKVWIDYALPRRPFGHGLGKLFGSIYAKWCVAKMTQDACLKA